MIESPRELLRSWWNQPDRFDWTTTFLRTRGLLRPAQLIMAVVAGASAVVPISDFVARHPGSWFTALVGVAAIVLSTGVTVFWLTRWPTRRQSAGFVVAGMVSIVVWIALQPMPTVAAIACTATAVTGGYVAFFHGPRLLALNLLAAVVATGIASVRVARDDGGQAAFAAFWAIWFVNLVVPLVIWGTTRAMSHYATRSDEDSLTGLLNRRAFVEAIRARVGEGSSNATHLTVALVDIDDFKLVNDTHGHDVGDRVLLAVAELLRLHAPPDALVCRAGGEEFLVASLSNSALDGEPIAQRMCVAISTASHAITASIGSVTAALDRAGGSATRAFVEELIIAADRAMYAAKRNGGNQVQLA